MRESRQPGPSVRCAQIGIGATCKTDDRREGAAKYVLEEQTSSSAAWLPPSEPRDL